MAGKVPDYGFPVSCGETKLVALVRDPYCLFVYWDVAPDQQTLLSLVLQQSWQEIPLVLRLYDLTGVIFQGNNANCSADFVVGSGQDHRYLENLAPNRRFCVDLGVITGDGRFFTIARSNLVQTPPDRVREEPDTKAGFGLPVTLPWVTVPVIPVIQRRQEINTVSSSDLARREVDRK